MNKALILILSVIFPPIAVYLKEGFGTDLAINIVLCFFLFIPAIIHALILNLK